MYAARQSKRNEEISEIDGSVMHPSGAEGAETVDLVAHRSARVVAASPRSAILWLRAWSVRVTRPIGTLTSQP